MTARTLQLSHGPEQKVASPGDSITTQEFVAYVLRFVTDTIDTALSHQETRAQQAAVSELEQSVVALASVDAQMLSYARNLTRTKSLFKATDADQSGTISKKELFTALRRFKVPVTKIEFAEVFRVIDPDQSHQLTLDEWVHFMSATDAVLDLSTSASATFVGKDDDESVRAATPAASGGPRGVGVVQVTPV
jgi:hypothetical protein